jgi:hypothetical protein
LNVMFVAAISMMNWYVSGSGSPVQTGWPTRSLDLTCQGARFCILHLGLIHKAGRQAGRHDLVQDIVTDILVYPAAVTHSSTAGQPAPEASTAFWVLSVAWVEASLQAVCYQHVSSRGS